MDLSIVIPIKDERDNLGPLLERLHATLDTLGKTFEVIFVDDGSGDGSFEVLEALALRDPAVKVVQLRRNFGQSAAVQAGFDFWQGDVLITMDGELLIDPADIPRLLAKLEEGFDAVLGLRAKRQDALWVRKIPSLMGNWLIRKVTGVTVKDMGCTLRALRHDLAEALPLYGEMHRFVPVLCQQYGGRLVQIPVTHHPRTAGKTKYNLTRTFRVILDLITVKFLHSYLTRPMHVMGLAGLVCMGLGVVTFLATVAMKYLPEHGTFMTGNPLLLLSCLFELVGVQFISIGLLGEVMTRTYFESQGKKSYAVRTTLNMDTGPRRHAA
jgi:glycosyltransferase involved in cell wall biosynthesis